MRPVTSMVDLLNLTKTDVRYKWLIVKGYISGNGYTLVDQNIKNIYYEDALEWMLKWLKENVRVNDTGCIHTCKSMVLHINNEIPKIIDRTNQILKPEFNSEPKSRAPINTVSFNIIP